MGLFNFKKILVPRDNEKCINGVISECILALDFFYIFGNIKVYICHIKTIVSKDFFLYMQFSPFMEILNHSVYTKQILIDLIEQLHEGFTFLHPFPSSRSYHLFVE